MKEITLIISVVTLLSCNSKNRESSKTIDVDSSVVQNITQYTITETRFSDFFERFMWDQEFQKSRVLFPFKQNNETISSHQDWKHLPFYSDYIPILSSDTIEYFLDDSTRNKFEFSMIDFQKRVSEKFNFKKINNQWFILSSESSSIEIQPDFEFLEFLINWSNDSTFQINHTRFPFPESYADSENDYENATRLIERADWKHLKLIPHVNKLMIFPNMTVDATIRSIFFRGIENGIWIEYSFEKIDGIWKLTGLEDYST